MPEESGLKERLDLMKVYAIISMLVEDTDRLEELSKMMYDSAAHIIFADPQGGDTICELDVKVRQVSRNWPS